jgi:fatty acid desaturase
MRPNIPSQALKELSARSDARGLAHLVGHLGAISCAMALVLGTRGTAWVWPAMALLGVLEVALFAPLHETTHRTPFRSLPLNRATGWLAGFVLLLPPEGFRLFHLAHHRHTQDPARDPELVGAEPLSRGRYLLVLTGLPYWAGQLRLVLRHASGHADESWIPPASRPAVTAEARTYLVLYAALAVAAVAARSPLPLLLWAVPVLLGQPVLRAVLLAEHAGLPLVADTTANTRTTLAGRLVWLLFWNANFHAEHNLAPGVPFHALPRLHALARDQLRALERSYPAAHRTIRAGLTEAATAR